MLSGFKASVQNELDAFFPQLDNQADLARQVSAQAFSKARHQFSATAFSKLNERLMADVTSRLDVPLWHGRRVVAADASKLQLFLEDATGRKVREAVAFVLYLPILEMSLGFHLYSPSCGERQMLFEHLDMLDANDLLVLDRGYPAHWLAAVLSQRHIDFCMRVDRCGFACVKTFLRSGQAEAWVDLPAPSLQDCADYGCARTLTRVRLIRVTTPNGKVQVLMTSLLDVNAYPATSFADLYHQRWRIEELFKRLKHRISLEHLSGLSWLAAQQDFGAKILCDNLNALVVLAAQAEGTDDISKNYRINRIYVFATLKRCLPRWLLKAWPTPQQWLAVLANLARNLCRFVPGASKPRPERDKPHLHHAFKGTT
jgi:hypothetical protein